MDHLNMETPNGNELNLEALYKIFPSCFTEASGENGEMRKVVDLDKLRSLLGENVSEGAPETYDFTWVGKRAARKDAAAPIRKTLRPCPEESVDWDTTKNLYIEGDNLEVLKLLQNSYMGKVKMIYIDPPYNTGNDFVYHDDFAMSSDEYDESNRDEEGQKYRKNTDSNGRFHSDWCSMMYSRLLVARPLLKDDGVIFISIDDNELNNLQKICNEVFGEKNFFSLTIIRSNSRGQTYKQIAKTHEYLLIITKSEDTDLFELEKDLEKSDLNLVDNIGQFNIRELRNRNPKFGKHNRPGLFYPFYVNPRICDKDGFCPISLEKSTEYDVEVLPFNSEGKESCWRWGPVKSFSNINEATLSSNLIAKRKSSGGFNIYEKYRKTTYKPKSIWDDNAFLTETGTVEIHNLGFTTEFDFPKPVELIRRCIQLSTTDDDIILDFFSGSGTTAHAVMLQNFYDANKRQFIMVQLPEELNKNGYSTLCKVAEERIRRAGKSIYSNSLNNNTLFSENISDKHLDTGFRVFKCDDSNMKDVYFTPKDYSQEHLLELEDNIKEGRSDLDLLYDCMLRWGLELSLPVSSTKVGDRTIHNVNDGDLVACFDGEINSDVIDSIATMSPLRVVFRDKSFTEAAEKMNLFELFKQKCNWTEEEVRNNVKVI